MARIEMEIESDLPADRVLAALVDFSDRRPELWPGLKRKEYRVFEIGDT